MSMTSPTLADQTPRRSASPASWPILWFLPARLVFALLAQGLAAVVLSFTGSSDPWAEAVGWWPVYSTLTDVLCLISLAGLTRREGIGLSSLLGVTGRAVFKEFAWTPAYLLAILPAAFLASLVTRLFHGSAPPPYLTAVNLPPAASLYALLVWPVIWVIAEELVYLGYLLPRLEAWCGRTLPAAGLVVLFWGLQHLAIPFIGDPTYLVSRVLPAWLATGGVTLVFVLGKRRIIPIMGAHYIFDLATAFLVTASFLRAP